MSSPFRFPKRTRQFKISVHHNGVRTRFKLEPLIDKQKTRKTKAEKRRIRKRFQLPVSFSSKKKQKKFQSSRLMKYNGQR